MGVWAEWADSAEWAEWADWAEVTKWMGLHGGWGGEWLAGWKWKGPVEGRKVVRRKRRRTTRRTTSWMCWWAVYCEATRGMRGGT